MERGYGTGVGQGTMGERMTEGILRPCGGEPCAEGGLAGAERGLARVPEVFQPGGRLRWACASRPRVHPE